MNIEFVSNNCCLINGIRLKMSAEMVQDLQYNTGYGAEEHFITMYHQELARIRDKKLESLGL